MLGVVENGHKGQWVHRETEVQAVVQLVKIPYKFIVHRPVLDVLENSAARAGDLTKVLVTICRLILCFQLLGILEESLTEPCARHV